MMRRRGGLLPASIAATAFAWGAAAAQQDPVSAPQAPPAPVHAASDEAGAAADPAPADGLRGPAALRSLLGQLRRQPVVSLRGPAAQPGTPSGLSMTIQIGENRFYQFNNLSGARLLVLGALEPGWTTFRFADVKTFAVTRKAKPVLLQADLSCSGGFDVRGDQELEIVLVHGASGLTCALR
jgi:hypothetical protein